ncbi:thiamine phosphate synthase [Methylobacterium sp. Leaf466]|uniref:thiamine phosphate synthase n=1 Tax=Methylobacterium sp. Leaf466 TaxID=1736386 RepID=UPI0006F4D6F7|nr:thiamine phosphate synthase [Methylobacterium sp. Leaf466]KQT84220.1 thiamine monophosphate synthase [Methylobacterium sp. Leaf466]
MKPLPSPLLVVTDRGPIRSPSDLALAGARLLATVEAALEGGARWLWFREKDMASGERRRLAVAVMTRVRAFGGTFTLGGEAAAAVAIGADGVHLTGDATQDAIAAACRAMPDGLVGVSAHGASDIGRAAAAGADYATLSPIFLTASKPGYGPALGVDAIRAASGSGLPVIALGGIAPAHVAGCRGAGAAGIAVMGGIMAADDPGSATARYLGAWTG